MALLKIVSGGQTGVDRGALDAALQAHFPCGGWCPTGRMAEDGLIPEAYPLTELQHGNYRQRTIQNVKDSDGTALIYFGQLAGGTEQTLLHCIRNHKPYKLIDAEEVPALRAAQQFAAFISAHAITTLNIAGPRLSKAPSSQAYTFEVVTHLLRTVGPGHTQQAADYSGSEP